MIKTLSEPQIHPDEDDNTDEAIAKPFKLTLPFLLFYFDRACTEPVEVLKINWLRVTYVLFKIKYRLSIARAGRS
jgi:hypothetical protein